MIYESVSILRTTYVRSINFTNMKLDKINININKFINVFNLDISFNKLPKEIYNLNNLQYFLCNNNHLVKLSNNF